MSSLKNIPQAIGIPFTKTYSSTPPTSTQVHQELHARERRRRSSLNDRASSNSQPSAYSANIARLRVNQKKNRYSDILPYDRTRVLVDGNENEEGYLNANWVKEVDGERSWVAASAPLPNTVASFYTFLLTSNTQTIVQLTGLVESGVLKADPYVPSDSSPVSFPDATLPGSIIEVRRVNVEKYHAETDCYITELEIQGRGSVKLVKHLFFGGWPDRGVPTGEDSTMRLIDFIKLANSLNSTSRDPLGPPILVHCSAGVGRTGAYISIASLLRLYATFNPSRYPSPPESELGPLPDLVKDDPVARTIDYCRDQRTTMVQTAEQVDLVCRASDLILKDRLWN
ncbi:Protein tyrosine phosphatase, contains fn3 domain [Phaffia rhodozyma]|uniref:Protein tyrosine phosphatase, contains fn3 domain n=1 Tax=Phaffia rhodozyma TaxID=264483 RepID=A0A0F7SL12_PHARH|nr:Protein tyrosine phosphatase, contains fn3 domain [Phaffia rhodozyma]